MSDFPAVPLILDRKAPGHVQVVVGDLQCQIDFLADIMSRDGKVSRMLMDHLEDAPVLEALQDPGPTLFIVPKVTQLSLASDTRAKIGVWSATPLKPHSAAIRILVRQAMAMVEVKDLADGRIDIIGDAILADLGEEAMPQALIWEAAWQLTDASPGQPPVGWVQPWENYLEWARCSAPLPARLHSLYKDLCGFVFGLDNDMKCAQALGIAPSRFAWLKTLRLNLQQVEQAILVLSRWRTQASPDQALRVALQVSSIFSK